MRRILFCLSFLALTAAGLEFRETFNSCGYYFTPGRPAPEKVLVQFRAKGDSKWLNGLEPAWFEAEKTFRGSIVRLRENTGYELRITMPDGQVLEQGVFQTWSSTVPVAATVDIRERQRNGIIKITDKGNANGWIRFTAPPGTVIDGNAAPGHGAILLDGAEYVILEGLTVRGGPSGGPEPTHGIKVEKSRFVRIANCDIGGWGRTGTLMRNPKIHRADGGKSATLLHGDSGIWITDSRGVVVERCFIHDPRSKSTGWLYGHPIGPNAIRVNANEQTVVRYNDLVGSDDEYRWNDVIESGDNMGDTGGFYRDADIYGNYLAFPHDDGMELDGGQMNIRVFENKFEGGYCGISTIACRLGPSYIFNNLFVNITDTGGQGNIVIKDMVNKYGPGRIYYFNNTIYSDGIGFPETPYRMRRNNVVFSGYRPGTAAGRNGVLPDVAYEVLHSFRNFPPNAGSGTLYGARPVFMNPDRGLFALTPDSIGAAEGTMVFNFQDNDKYMGALIPGGRETGPARPLEFQLDCGQLNFDRSVSEAGFILRTSAAFRPQTLKVQKNQSFSWLKITPAEIAAQPGREYRFTVSVVPGEFRRPGLHSGAFLVRDADGLSRPVTVYAVQEGSVRGLECASGAIELRREDAAGSAKAPEWVFEVPLDQEYYILAESRGRRFKYQVEFSLDDEPFRDIKLNNHSYWYWSGIRPVQPTAVARWVGGRFVLYKLKQGTHKVRLRLTGDIELLRIVLTPDFTILPGNSNNFDFPVPENKLKQ